MLDSIIWFIPKIFTFYFLIVTFISGFICYFFLNPSLKDNFPTEAKIAKIGGMTYMIIAPLFYFLTEILF